ncbi:hypothetical protein AOT93_03105 [Mycobacteroides sp. H110]|nr:hypothetical protein AOT87_08560 [Mycobacteroides sp. H003]KRQ35687.1 hypothetical protein AOT91_03945 [Mycobacteroides sp. H092]KRQ39456.1 hypothetical protein AOT92_19745 [Mycobacteroides sp. H101]KRQ53469.1 hypothetical protein AOT88_00660 [Mycobacteroides sp. H063]KRQ59077.1 hypothetical protein AOT90_23965 [Mycobacteroides sp. H079]KRQ59868.1 hypothetical protein AOT94_08610 [Mycobacteroides sp. HXVII]KRQ81897.1 hypothetical protein AOT95_09365 [Mycobacteroides sp. HXXIII]KRQ85092.1 
MRVRSVAAMSTSEIRADQLRAGDFFEHWARPQGEDESRMFTTEVLRDAEPHQDRFGQELLKFYCRVDDPATGGVREGYVIYGPHAVVSRIAQVRYPEGNLNND